MTLEYFDSLDAYRAFAMLGGVLLHGAMAYVEPEIRIWPVKNPQGQLGFTVLLFVVHAFRLQAFFMMAGFFSGLLLEKRGITQFITNRLKRVGLPLLLGSVVLIPMIQALFVWGYQRRGYGGTSRLGHIEVNMPDYYGSVGDFFVSGRFLSGFLWFHLWFLFYLLIVYAIWLMIEKTWRSLQQLYPSKMRTLFHVRVTREVRGQTIFWHCLPLILSVPTAATMFPMQVWQADSPTRVLPQWPIVFYYSIFFLVGRWIYSRRGMLNFFRTTWKWYLAVGLCVVGPVMLFFQTMGPHTVRDYRPDLQIPAILTYSLFSWLMVFGWLGFFETYFDRPRPGIRYVADSAYWQYLAHMPVIVAFQLWIDDWTWPNLAKYLFACAGTYGLMFVSYHWLVRRTWLGQLLNGRRYVASP